MSCHTPMVCRDLVQCVGAAFWCVLVLALSSAVGAADRQMREAAAAFCERLSFKTRNLGYSIPTLKWAMYADLRTRPKTKDFAAHVPGWKSINGSVSSFLDERAYLESYSSARYGLTRLKGGWDCLRHYEIILAGCVPYFIGLQDMPLRTMARFPKEIVYDLMRLPGVPSEEDVHVALVTGGSLPSIDYDTFPEQRYEQLRSELLAYAEQQLLAQHAVAEFQLKPMGVLVQSATDLANPEDYLRDLVIIGLVERGVRVYVASDVSYLFQGSNKDFLASLYGRGFTYGWSLPREAQAMVSVFDLDPPPRHTWPLITYIKTTKGNWGFPAANLLDRNADIFIDGNDITAPHPEPSSEANVQLFRRELYECHSQVPAAQIVFFMLDSEALWACQIPSVSNIPCPGQDRAAQMWLFAVQGLQSLISSQQRLGPHMREFYAETALLLENVYKVIKTFLGVLASREQYQGDLEAVSDLSWHIAREGMESFRNFALQPTMRKTELLLAHDFQDECLLFASRYCAASSSKELPVRDGSSGGRIARAWGLSSREACSNLCVDMMTCTHYSYTKGNGGDCLLYDVCPAGKCYGGEACAMDTLTYSMAPCDFGPM